MVHDNSHLTGNDFSTVVKMFLPCAVAKKTTIITFVRYSTKYCTLPCLKISLTNASSSANERCSKSVAEPIANQSVNQLITIIISYHLNLHCQDLNTIITCKVAKVPQVQISCTMVCYRDQDNLQINQELLLSLSLLLLSVPGNVNTVLFSHVLAELMV